METEYSRSPIDTSDKDVFVETLNTIYSFKNNEFCRMAINNQNRPALWTVEGPQMDGDWKEFDKAELVASFDGRSPYFYINILPSGRPEGSIGINTSKVVAIHTFEKEQINE